MTVLQTKKSGIKPHRTRTAAIRHSPRHQPLPAPASGACIGEQTEIQARLPVRMGLTVLIPAYNEAEMIADTIRSVQQQTMPPDEIIVIDDCSTDNTAAVARACGARVVQPPHNTGSKAGAQNYALARVRTEFVMAIDADTTLAPDAIEQLASAMTDSEVAAACGFVIPRYVRSIWERGRYVEYLFAFNFYKPVQDYYGKPLVSSGCFSIYRTAILHELKGWPERTMTEDLDLTWSMYIARKKVRYIPSAVCYPIEPHNYTFMYKQLRRWSHGFVQNVRLHWKALLEVPHLRAFVAVAMWDAAIASLVYLLALPLLAIVFASPLPLLGYLVDLPVVAIPVLLGAARRRELPRALLSLPAFLVLRILNAALLLEAIVSELVLRRPLRTYEKGH